MPAQLTLHHLRNKQPNSTFHDGAYDQCELSRVKAEPIPFEDLRIAVEGCRHVPHANTCRDYLRASTLGVVIGGSYRSSFCSYSPARISSFVSAAFRRPARS